MTGYQEVMTDPSYAAQIVTFTFPHIGNVGANYEDLEADNPFALGCVVREDVTAPSNFRAVQGFDAWMKANGRIGLSGVDTRALTRKIRVGGARSEEHTSELQSLMRNSYAVFCLKTNKK